MLQRCQQPCFVPSFVPCLVRSIPHVYRNVVTCSLQHTRARKSTTVTAAAAAQSLCPRCNDQATEACPECEGTGQLPRGGYHKHNPVNAARVVGSKWTAMARTLGWRHYRVIEKRKQGKETYVLLVATCDEDTKLWVPIKTLRERSQWATGWLQKRDLLAMDSQGAECKRCGGSGRVPCMLCGAVDGVVAL